MVVAFESPLGAVVEEVAFVLGDMEAVEVGAEGARAIPDEKRRGGEQQQRKRAGREPEEEAVEALWVGGQASRTWHVQTPQVEEAMQSGLGVMVPVWWCCLSEQPSPSS